MPNRISISDAARHAGESVEIAGWLYNLRKSGKIVFPIELREVPEFEFPLSEIAKCFDGLEALESTYA